MDATVERAVDVIADGELPQGFRIKEVPEATRKELRDEGLPELTYVLFRRLNPRRRATVAKVVQGAYHKDLKDPDVMSTEQLLLLAKERGEWSDAYQKEMDDLKEKVNESQRELYVDGIKNASWLSEYETLCREIRESVREFAPEDDAEAKAAGDAFLEVFARWSTYDIEDQASYDLKYAATQSADDYSPDRDLNWMVQRAPTFAMREQIERVEELRLKLGRYRDFLTTRDKRDELTQRHARIMSESAEARRDNMQAMATVYHCSVQCDADGVASGALAPTFDAFWDFPDNVVRWFVDEYFFFANNIPEAARDYLETFGFLPKAAQAAQSGKLGEFDVSVVSPEVPTAKPDTTPVVETAASSLASPTTTT